MFSKAAIPYHSDLTHLPAMAKFKVISNIGALVNVEIFTMLSTIIYYVIVQCISLLIVFFTHYAVS